jgi:RNA processing factor Prp31
MLKNVKQFKSSDDVDALKNLAEEFVDLGNVHHELQDYISKELVRLMRRIDTITENISNILKMSSNKKELYE